MTSFVSNIKVGIELGWYRGGRTRVTPWHKILYNFIADKAAAPSSIQFTKQFHE